MIRLSHRDQMNDKSRLAREYNILMRKAKKNTNKPSALQNQMNRYLDKNPSIKKSLKIFGMSMENYQKAINSLNQPKISISTTTTSINND